MPFTVKLMRSPLAVEFEVGSIEEGLGILQDSKDKFRELLEFSSELGGSADEAVTTAIAAAPGSETPEAPAKRGRGKGKAAEAVAPAPLAIPGAAPPTPPAPAASVDATPNANGIPAFLDRTAAAPPPPPLLPAAPPVAPPAATPPSGVLAAPIIKELERRAINDTNKAALVKWLSDAGITIPSASFDECLEVIRFTTDTKLTPIATALSIPVA